jgi:hypothetical protein
MLPLQEHFENCKSLKQYFGSCSYILVQQQHTSSGMKTAVCICSLAALSQTVAFVPCPSSHVKQSQLTSGAARHSVRMLAAPEGSNNIIPIIEQGDQEIKVEVFARPPPPPDRVLSHLTSAESLKESFPQVSDEYWGK